MDPRLELAQMLLRKANDDLAMARLLARDAASPAWGIAFHVQQAVEKSLKAVLSSGGIEYPRTHSILMLLDLLSDNGWNVPIDQKRLIALTPYGTVIRYDDMDSSPSEVVGPEEWSEMLALAGEATAWAEGQILS